LEVGKVFRAWITERIEQFDFIEGRDYLVSSESGRNPLGGRPSREYHVSLSMAKELAMVERSAKGKQARLYFIECERLAKEAAAKPIAVPDLSDHRVLLPLLTQYAERTAKLEQKVAEQEPIVQAVEAYAVQEGELCMRDAAKRLGIPPNSFKYELVDLGFGSVR
jgi:anti-repressor protein